MLQFPTRFYDREILERAGHKLGMLLKIDACTSATLRGRYTPICVQVLIGTPVKREVVIGTHLQKILYEGDGILCTTCGRLGHVARLCKSAPSQTPADTNAPSDTMAIVEESNP